MAKIGTEIETAAEPEPEPQYGEPLDVSGDYAPRPYDEAITDEHRKALEEAAKPA